MTEAVLRNLLNNAWKYTRQSAKLLIRVYAGEIHAEGRPGAGATFCVTLHDLAAEESN